MLRDFLLITHPRTLRPVSPLISSTSCVSGFQSVHSIADRNTRGVGAALLLPSPRTHKENLTRAWWKQKADKSEPRSTFWFAEPKSISG